MRVGYAVMGLGPAVVRWPDVIGYDLSMPLHAGVVAVLLTAMSLLGHCLLAALESGTDGAFLVGALVHSGWPWARCLAVAAGEGEPAPSPAPPCSGRAGVPVAEPPLEPAAPARLQFRSPPASEPAGHDWNSPYDCWHTPARTTVARTDL
jgi:hypothetical protein